MPLNYSKWDALELSDDSDIEEHPNIDKKSMIRWKQQDIHQKRQERTLRIAKLRTEADLNDKLRPRIVSTISSLSSSSPASAKESLSSYASLIHQLTTKPSDDKPPTGAPNQPTYDVMLLHLLEQVWKEAKEALGLNPGEVGGGEGKEEELREKLRERLAYHNESLDKRTKECRQEAEREEKEEKKKITSEGIHDGFSSGYVNQAGQNPLEEKKKESKPKKKETSMEVLNPGASTPSTESPDSDAEDDELPDASPVALEFIKLRYLDFDGAFSFIQSNPSVMEESTTDGLLLEGFNAELKGQKDKAKRCVEKGLLVQYCRKLGKDGFRLFFQRMRAPGENGKKALAVFTNDVDATYTRMETRVREMNADTQSHLGPAGESEQIQLVAEGTNTISFNLPDGPPPAEIRFEGEGTEDWDVEEVRAFLQKKWDIFQAFDVKMQEALKSEDLEKVNKVLGKMSVDKAEAVVGKMHEAGILSFQDDGQIRDETAK